MDASLRPDAGAYRQSAAPSAADHRYNDLCDLMARAARGAVNLLTRKYRLNDFQCAIDDLDSGDIRGRAVPIA
ncbi:MULTISPECIES: hypothetical protein [Mycobacterium]|uniref:Uncharacterized protein n=1 Tax=Mycobacterium kiyosense TaxID=2871094 RepID=A0A9P3QB66_9MYCO|nr:MULTISPECIES: hypothetical protein [Mycobacterium]BDB40173.1 hypothetical protein IWGMT90018_06190 [Mycobacterium kiyosense]BDE12005.1 hypothetical protein MKCMC460_08650 [Mycobacterium sp. 20KCMC460]GLB84246.1 hypothetical protein SRL2020028_35020 [Mycobacterium kiyosense]GLB91666.1 hypothetical protein SRL2020130_44830 [Mycobacterium kiyosense]GLB97653.1 hypothetical protein SRL2020226_44290 [Mycobacterium kiyosense]